MTKKQFWLLIIGVLFILFVVNYNYLDSLVEEAVSEYEEGIVKRIIDGDTIEVGNESVRMLGINSPERGEKGYSEAKSFLEEEILGKEVRLYFGYEKYDRYYRKLAYVYLDLEDICMKSVSEGYSNVYFPANSRKSKEFELYLKAWQNCVDTEKGLCEKSEHKCKNCVKVVSLDVNEQKIVLRNLCSFNCGLTGWSVKDEGRKKYVFGDFNLKGNSEIGLDSEDFGEDYVWTESGDSFFIRDSENKLVSWGSY